MPSLTAVTQSSEDVDNVCSAMEKRDETEAKMSWRSS